MTPKEKQEYGIRLLEKVIGILPDGSASTITLRKVKDIFSTVLEDITKQEGEINKLNRAYIEKKFGLQPLCKSS